MINWNKPIRFRENTFPVRFVTTIKHNGSDDRVLVIYEDTTIKREVVLTVSLNGEKYAGQISPWDVINQTEKKMFYMNIYRGPSGVFPGKLFENESECRRAASTNKSEVIKTVAIELEL